MRYTLTPRLSAATGCSPAARIRRPRLVRHRITTDAGTSARARSVAHEMSLVMPDSTADRSDTRNHPRSSTQPKRSGVDHPNRSPPDRNGRSSSPTESTLGDWVMPPPGRLANTSRDRNRASAGARMLMATPEMMWSTPNPTVATAWSRPPAAPPAMPMAMPHHGPNSSAPQAPNQVPRIIIPSRPMLTTPARSAHMPPRPASRMGTARRSVASAVPAEIRSVVSGRANSWATDRASTRPSAATIQRRTTEFPSEWNRPAAVMFPPPASDGWQRRRPGPPGSGVSG